MKVKFNSKFIYKAFYDPDVHAINIEINHSSDEEITTFDKGLFVSELGNFDGLEYFFENIQQTDLAEISISSVIDNDIEIEFKNFKDFRFYLNKDFSAVLFSFSAEADDLKGFKRFGDSPLCFKISPHNEILGLYIDQIVLDPHCKESIKWLDSFLPPEE